MKKAILLLLAISAHAYSYELSDLNGTWTTNVGGLSMQYVVSGLPTSSGVGESFSSNHVAYAQGVSVRLNCRLKKLNDNLFDSKCSAMGLSDHSQFRFIDQNTTIETNLRQLGPYGPGMETVSYRQ